MSSRSFSLLSLCRKAPPIKGILLKTPRGQRKGDLIITRYGLEGTPIYTLGASGIAHLDLKPDLSSAELLSKARGGKENLSPIRRIKHRAGLCPAAYSLVFHLTPPKERENLEVLITEIKNFPILLTQSQSLDEAISSSGGLSWDELDSKLMLKQHPFIFVAGEMLDWDAPTGGFLIQGCVSLGRLAATELLKLLTSQ